ncbi:phosphopantetheine-binding protein [Streptomyces fagopyri]|uniref:phosphopantetheine-binding protein n=1 Tax=Streptomyces fagopyri TaxID=2662397 RepID=UPI0038121721
MTSAPHPHRASPTPAADVLAELTAVLAGMMRVEPQSLGTQDSFRLLGLDSMLSAEFVAALNARYGTRIAATALYEHPTPAALARHVAAELAAPAPLPGPAERHGDGQPTPTPTLTPTPTPTPTLAPVPVRGAGLWPVAGPDTVTDTLRTQLAGILHCGVRDIDVSAPFAALGLDSILAAEFLAGINRTYGLSEQTDLLYDHPDLAAMAAHVTAQVTDTRTTGPAPASAAAPAPASTPVRASTPVPMPAPVAESGPAAPGGRADTAPRSAHPPRSVEIDLNALLDAVRDEVLSIDEAAALLAARSA